MKPAPLDPPQIEEQLWTGFGLVHRGFDIGANVGQSIGNMLGVCDEVVAFEPAIESYAELVSTWGHHEQVQMVSVAISDHTGMIKLVETPQKIATGQLVTGDFASEWRGEGDWDMAGAVDREVPAWTLDDAADQYGPPDFLKIDVEGHELRVLQSGEAVVDNGVQMLVEIHAERLGVAIRALLGDRYRVDEVRHPNYDPGSRMWRTHYWLKCWPV